VGALIGLLYWAFGVGAAMTPIYYAASNHLHDSLSTTLINAYTHHYRDIAIMVVAVIGASFADGFETVTRAGHRSLFRIFMLVLVLGVCTIGSFVGYNLGPHLMNTADARRLPYQVIVVCLVLCAIVKSASEHQRG